jgi:hypothetical protein
MACLASRAVHFTVVLRSLEDGEGLQFTGLLFKANQISFEVRPDFGS